MLQEAVNLETGFRCEYIFRTREDVFDESRWNDTQPNFPVNAAEGEIVDFIAEGRNVRTFGGIYVDRQHILAGEIEMRRQFKGEWCIPSFIFTQTSAIDRDG